MNTWFTSDLHFGHAKVIEYCQRPFANVQEMDQALIANWNARVRPDDHIYVVGDFSFAKPERTREIYYQLQGHKFLVRGNHDHSDKIKGLFEAQYDLHTVRVQDHDLESGVQEIVLCHYAMRVWNKKAYGAWHLYGHSHGSMPDDLSTKSLDIGVDCHNYRPVTYEEVKAMMDLRANIPSDGHGQEAESEPQHADPEAAKRFVRELYEASKTIPRDSYFDFEEKP